jgi:hypothetical protein
MRSRYLFKAVICFRRSVVTKFWCGLDLGQSADYSALAIIARPEESIDSEEPAYVVRYLKRWPLGTRYREVVQDVKDTLSKPPLAGNYKLAVDETGVGRAVSDMLREGGLRFTGVTITAGAQERREGHSAWVPKRYVIAGAQVLLQNRRLKIVPSLPEASILTQELQNFRYKISTAGNDLYEAWREGDHDDLVLAVSLAVWLAQRGYGELRGKDLAIGYDSGIDELFGRTQRVRISNDGLSAAWGIHELEEDDW